MRNQVYITNFCDQNKIVLTRNISDHHRKTYFYGCETQLMQSQVPCVFVELMDPADVCSVIADMLKYRGRSLNDKQMRLIVDRSQQESSALYLSLAVSVVSKWNSYMGEKNAVLSSGVSQLIKQIFIVAEISFGRVIIRAALGFITMSIKGLSDNEVLDLISLHEDAMLEVNQYAITNSYKLSQRLLSHVWLRISEFF